MSAKRTENDSHGRQRRRRAAFLRERLSPRVRDVFTDLMAGKQGVGAYVESQCLKVAELTVRAEDLRAKLAAMLAAAQPDDTDPVRSLAALINSVTRLESTTRRAAADLAKITPAAPVATLDQLDWESDDEETQAKSD
jgi:hypothetical protein